jgi:hypothetical protein
VELLFNIVVSITRCHSISECIYSKFPAIASPSPASCSGVYLLSIVLNNVFFFFWYASVPFFLWRRKELLSQNPSHSLSSHHHQQGTATHQMGAAANAGGQPAPSVAVIKRVVVTVVVLAAVYLICWTPYWMGMYAQRLFRLQMTKQSLSPLFHTHKKPHSPI